MKIFSIKFVLFFCVSIFFGVMNTSGPSVSELLATEQAELVSSPRELEEVLSEIAQAGFPDDPKRGMARALIFSPESQRFWYLRSLANYDKNWRKLKREGPWETLSVRKPADYLYAMTSVELFFQEYPELRVDYASERVFPPEEAHELVKLIREMQDLSADSPFRGNFRWYWRQKTVEDRNAVEFVVKRLIFCWFYQNLLPESSREPILEILRDSAQECLRRMVKPDYSNIAVMNFANLILLGEALNEPELKQEGIRRMNRFLFQTWDSGIFEFSTPTYFSEIFEVLEQLKNLTRDSYVRERALTLLDYLALLTAVHWTEDGTFSGACSRTYSYLLGDVYLRHHVGVWGWAELPKDRSDITILAALNGKYLPPEWIDSLRGKIASSERTVIHERWGKKAEQHKKTLRTPFFAHGVSAVQYGSRQDQLWTVDWKKTGPEDKNPRCFFMPDGRNDPWGIARESTGGGHQKALHLDPEWHAELKELETKNFSGENTFRSLAVCRVVYPQNLIQKFLLEKGENERSIQSVFVLKTPDSFSFESQNRLLARYGKHQMILTVTSLSQGVIAQKLLPSPDGNAVAWCVTHDTEAAEEIQIDFEAEIVLLEETAKSEISLEKEEETRKDRETQSVERESFSDEILTINGLPLGKKFLESRLSSLKNFSEERKSWFSETWEKQLVITLKPQESFCFSAIKGHFFPDFIASDGQAVVIQNATYFRFRIDEPGRFRLAAFVLAPDGKQDSLQLTYWTPEIPHGIHFPCWALDSSSDWRWVEFRVPNQKSLPVDLNLPSGVFLLKLEPREFNVQLRELRLTRIE